MVKIEELKEMFVKIFGDDIDVSDFNENSDLRKDIKMTSISFLYMAMVLEERYSVHFTNDDFPKITTVKDVVDLIESKVNSK